MQLDKDGAAPDSSEPRRRSRARNAGNRRAIQGNGSRKRSGDRASREAAETRAVVLMQKALAPLDDESRSKVLGWFGPAGPSGKAAGLPEGEASFEDLAAVFEAARPATDADRALAACYFRNSVLGEAEVTARTLSDDLKEIGHKLGNISRCLTSLNVRTPSLVMISPRKKGAHSRYRVTSAGKKYLREMTLGGSSP